MTPIRPAAAGPTADIQRTDAARAEAQRAFFAAAMGQPVQPRAQAPEPMRSVPVQRLPDPAAEPPARILRPGSLLDIRV